MSKSLENLSKDLKTRPVTRLVIDSATKFLYVALYQDYTCVNYYYKEGNNDHSVKLMLEIQRILREEAKEYQS